MLACSPPGVTPPLVNTGLEVSSLDKNTPTSLQRERKRKTEADGGKQIPFACTPIMPSELKIYTLPLQYLYIYVCNLCKKKTADRESVRL